MLKLMEEIAEISVEIYELCLKKESREIAVKVAGYTAMKINPILGGGGVNLPTPPKNCRNFKNNAPKGLIFCDF